MVKIQDTRVFSANAQHTSTIYTTAEIRLQNLRILFSHRGSLTQLEMVHGSMDVHSFLNSKVLCVF